MVQTGKINDVGAYTRINVPNSYRLGIELQGSARLTDWFTVTANATLSRNKIKAFTEFIDDYDDGGQLTKDHKQTDISFSPAVIANGSLIFTPVKSFEISLISKYVGRQYLDNTGDKSRSLRDYYVQDIRAAYKFKKVLFNEWNIALQVNNIFSRRYEPNGYTFSYQYENKLTTENYYFPMAPVNYMLAVNIKL